MIDNISVKIYDPAKKELIATYNSYKDASQKLGMTYKVLKIAAKTKTRRFCERLNKEIAIREASLK
jgi:hypothetical protein